MLEHFGLVETLMKKMVFLASMFIASGAFLSACTNNAPNKVAAMTTIEGKFEVNLTPQDDTNAPVGRMVIHKSYSGRLNGAGVGPMMSKSTKNGSAIYFAIEEFTGSVEGKQGGFTLVHKGVMNSEVQSLDVSVLQDSGTGELEGISGVMTITQKDGSHAYSFKYNL